MRRKAKGEGIYTFRVPCSAFCVPCFAFRVSRSVFRVLRSALRCERLAYAYTISRTPTVMA